MGVATIWVQLFLAAAAVGVTAFVRAKLSISTVDRNSALIFLLLLGLAILQLASTFWSVRPDLSLTEGATNAILAVVVASVVATGAYSASSRANLLQIISCGFFVIVTASILQSASGSGVEPFGDLANAARMRGSVGYWNATGLIAALGVVASVASSRMSINAFRLRLLQGAFTPIFVTGILLSQSRGALLGLFLGSLMILRLWQSGRSLFVAQLLGSALFALPLTWAGWLKVDAGELSTQGGTVGVVVAFALSLLGGVALSLLLMQRDWRPGLRFAASRRALYVAAVLVSVVTVTFAAREGLGGLSSVGSQITDDGKVPPVAGSARLTSISSSHRSGWWEEAIGVWSDNPLLGTGANSFTTARLQYRTNQTEVLNPHSLPLDLLSGTGIVGFALAFTLLLVAGFGVRLRLRQARSLDQDAALVQGTIIAMLVVWLASLTLDWTFKFVSIATPMLILLLVAVAPWHSYVVNTRSLTDDGDRFPASLLRTLSVSAVVVAALLLFLPWYGGRQAHRLQAGIEAAVSGAAVSNDQLNALSRRAQNFDFYGLQPFEVTVDFARVQKDSGSALVAAKLAVKRQRNNPKAWLLLAKAQADLQKYSGMKSSARQAVLLDPLNIEAQRLLSTARSNASSKVDSPVAAALGAE